MAQGFLSRVAMSPAWTRRLMNLWPPFRAAGIRVTHLADDWGAATVELRANAQLPIFRLPVLEPLQGFFWRADFTLVPGEIIHDYLKVSP